MLIMGVQQIQSFEDAAMQQFEDEMIEHCKKEFPRFCELLDQTQLRKAVHQATQRADTYGFTTKGSIRLYVEMIFMFGSDFDKDPQYSKFGKILTESIPALQRAEKLFNLVESYDANVAGPDDIHVNNSHQNFIKFIHKSDPISAENFEDKMIRIMTQMFPLKAEYIGTIGLKTLINDSHREARRLEFSGTQGMALLILLMFSFGYGCINDPLYSWIHKSLSEKKVVDSSAIVSLLKRNTVTWLDNYITNKTKGI